MSPWLPWSRCSTGIAGRSVASAVAATVSVADGIVGSAQAAAPAVMGEGGVIREPRSGADFVPRAALDAYSPALDVYSPAPAPAPVPGHLSVLVSVLAPSAARSADAKRAADGPGFAARCDWPRPIGFGGPLRVAVRYAASRLVQQARHAAAMCGAGAATCGAGAGRAAGAGAGRAGAAFAAGPGLPGGCCAPALIGMAAASTVASNKILVRLVMFRPPPRAGRGSVLQQIKRPGVHQSGGQILRM